MATSKSPKAIDLTADIPAKNSPAKLADNKAAPIELPMGSVFLENVTPLSENRASYTPGLSKMKDIPMSWVPNVEFTDKQQYLSQSFGKKFTNMVDTFRVGTTSGFLQGAINLLDVGSWGNDNYNSSLFGVSTKELADWSANVTEENEILTNPDLQGWKLSDPGWYMKHIAQSGTGVGMALFALAETAAIELSTGGMGTGVAIARLGKLVKNVAKLRSFKNKTAMAESLTEAYNIGKGMRNAATLYGILSRTNEGRMEAMQTYDTLYEEFSKIYPEDKAKQLAAEGADYTFYGNMALIPLDILSYRTMVFNPLKGGGVGFVENAFEKLGQKIGRGILGKSIAWTAPKIVGATSEGLEESFQFMVQKEAEQYAKAIGDGGEYFDNFLSRLGEYSKDDELWESFAGGVIGSPIIGGAMTAVDKTLNARSQMKLNSIHKNYIQNIGKYDHKTALAIKNLESQGKYEEASNLRRSFSDWRYIAGLQYDALTGKNTAYNAQLTFQEGLLEDLENNRLDALADVGINLKEATPEQIEIIKAEMTENIANAKKLKEIYEKVSMTHNKRFVPEIAIQQLNVEKNVSKLDEVNQTLTKAQQNVFGYSSLSSKGKEIFDAEYELQALQAEEDRLMKAIVGAENTYEKNSFKAQLSSVRKKASEVKSRVDAAGKDEKYTSEQREADKSIIEASVHDMDYLNAIYSKVRLENEISHGRQKLSLWNKQEYLDSKIKDSIKNAKVKEDLEETKKDLAKKKKLSKETKKEIEKKEKELAANNARKESISVVTAKNPTPYTDSNPLRNFPEIVTPTGPEQQIKGNAPLIGKEVSTIEEIGAKVSIPPDTINPQEDNREKDLFESPSPIDESQMTPELRQKLKEAVESLLNKLPKEASFEDVVRSFMSQAGKDSADTHFYLLVEGWKMLNKPTENFEAVYAKIFTDPINAIQEIGQKVFVKTSEEAEQKRVVEEGDKITKGIVEKEQGTPTIDNDNSVRYVQQSLVTDNPKPKLATLYRLYKRTVNKLDDNTAEISYEYAADGLNVGDLVDSRPLLHYDRFLPGEELEARIPPDFMDIPVTVYSDGGLNKKTMLFKDYILPGDHNNNKTLTPESQEYKDMIPLMIYPKGQTQGKGVAFVHSIAWYNDVNFLQSARENRDKAIAATRAIREKIISNGSEPTSLTITEKKISAMDPFKNKNTGNPKVDFIPLEESNPHAQVIMATNETELDEDERKRIVGDGVIVIRGTKPFTKGAFYDLRRIGVTADGKAAWGAFPLSSAFLSDEIKQTVRAAIKIYLHRNNPNPAIRKVHDAIAAKILEETGYDLLPKNGQNQHGIWNYLKQFINVHDFGKLSEENGAITMAVNGEKGVNSKIFRNPGYIGWTIAGALYLGAKKFAPFSKGGNPVQTIYSNSNSFNLNSVNRFLEYLDKPYITVEGRENGKPVKQGISVLDTFMMNFSKEAAKSNKPVVLIGINGEVKKVANSYLEFAKKNFTSNMRSLNISPEGEAPVYATATAMISYDLTENVKKDAQKEAVVEAVVEASAPIEPVAPNLEATEAEKKAQELLDRANKELGIDLDNLNNLDLLSPEPLEQGQRRNISRQDESLGLDPTEREQLYQFVYNSILDVIEANPYGITREELQKAIKKSLDDNLKAIKDRRKEMVKELEKLLTQASNLSEATAYKIPLAIDSYKREIDKLERVLNKENFDIIYSQIEEKTVRNLGIGQEKANEFDLSMNDEEFYEQEFEGLESWQQDSLSIDPNSRTSAALKRFYGNIPMLDENGKAITGVFGLPLYYNYAEIGSLLKASLADQVADFDTMLDYLSALKKFEWMPQFIEKIRNAPQQTKNQFVSDMTMNKLRMKFTMVTYNHKTKTYETSVWDANKGGVIDRILEDWKNNFYDSPMITFGSDGDGRPMLNKAVAVRLLATYKRWMGYDVPEVTKGIVDKATLINVKHDKNVPVNLPVTGDFYKELAEKAPNTGDRVAYKNQYEIVNVGNGKYEIGYFKKLTVNSKTSKEISEWLKAMGIELSEGALKELMEKGLRHNYKDYNFNQLFTDANGLFEILAKNLSFLAETPDSGYYFDESAREPFKEGVVKSLAALEYLHNPNVTPTGGYMNGKNFYPMTLPKFAVDRANELRQKVSTIRSQLQSISFSKNSFLLKLLEEDPSFQERFEIFHAAFSDLDIRGKTFKRDNALNKLSSLDYDVATIGKFWDMRQGNLSTQVNGIPLRIASMLMPTMSDKPVAYYLKTAVLNLSDEHLGDGNSLSDNVIMTLYEQVVKPEMERILNRAETTDIKGYDEGSKLFMLLPKINAIRYNAELTLQEALAAKVTTLEQIEKNEVLRGEINKVLVSTVMGLKEQRKASWIQDGIIQVNDKGETSVNYIDRTYFGESGKFSGTIEERVDKAILDITVNEMIHLANSFMLFAGDPAMYYKGENKSVIDKIEQKYDEGKISAEQRDQDIIEANIKASFVNVGKRLANQAAPGIKLAQSENEKYIQIFLEDRKTVGDKAFMKFVTKTLDGKSITDEEYDFVLGYLGKSKADLTIQDIEKYKQISSQFPKSSGYFSIEGSDAQEYTTWQEHLNVLEKLGKVSDYVIGITAEQIAQARALFSSKRQYKDFTLAERELTELVMQPLKPVVTGQIYDSEQDVMRTVYIKTSSFPLIPQLTAGFEIDKLRDAMEKLQKDSPKGTFVRASYQSGNKVGAKSKGLQIWDAEGRAKTENLNVKALREASLTLNRKDFRIQQEVPFKSKKNNQDLQTVGTQLMKLLFGDGVITKNSFMMRDSENPMSGTALWNEYNKLHNEMLQIKKLQLFEELGLTPEGRPIDKKATTLKLQEILKREAEDRNFPKQVIESLNLHEDGEDTSFTLPLWANVNSNKFESLLNAIVVNRLAKVKFPGNSYVAGSPEGFKTLKAEDEMSSDVTSQIVYTDSWDGDSLKASNDENGKINKIQVFVGSKFRDKDGNMINLLSDEWSEEVTDAQGKKIRKIRADKFDKELFELMSFRIPTTGLSSASSVEIVGFLPYTSADLMILPANLTKQKGLDFDIDKENTYQYWHTLTDKGKFERVSDKNISNALLEFETLMKYRKGEFTKAQHKLMNLFDGDTVEEYTQEDLDADTMLKRKHTDLKLQVIQNRIIDIYHSIFSNPDPGIQKSINSVLNTDFSEQQAEFISGLSQKSDYNWTPLSGMYQKEKVALGAGGKMGTGAYSMDVILHGLIQQSSYSKDPIEMFSYQDDEKTELEWRFGKLDDGGIESRGKLGLVRTLDGGRSIAELLNEVAQIAVDNEKLQVMGRLNLNAFTLDVHKVFNLLGFDKFGKGGNSIAYLFMSQPILREYVAEIAKSKSNLNTTFEADRKNAIVQKLIAKYYPDELNEAMDNETISDLLGEDNMIKAISSANPDVEWGKMQVAVLRRFMEMEQYGLALRNIQTTLNVDSKGLNKSFFDVINKKNKMARLGNDVTLKEGPQKVGGISNLKNLVGVFKPIPTSPTERAALISQGYYEMVDSSTGEGYMIKPDTFVGGFNIITTHTAYNLWREYLPYDSPVLEALYSEVLELTQDSDSDNEVREIEIKQEVLAEFKKYIATVRSVGFLGKIDDVNEERERLFIDTEENTSLASYIKELMESKGNLVVDTYLKSNKLFTSFSFRSVKTGEPSLIVFNNTKGEAWDEEYLYQAIASLFEVRGKSGNLPLPPSKKGDKNYTLDTLAQDLIAYCMLANAKQEAIQFTKYLPISYFNAIGYSYYMRGLHKKLNGSASDEAIGRLVSGLKIMNRRDKNRRHFVSEFTTQFIQHNPQMVRTSVSLDNFNKEFTPEEGVENSFFYNNDFKPTFIKVYDSSVKGKRKKFRLYKYNGITYNRIPLLGKFGMDEYQFGRLVGKSIVHPNYTTQTVMPAVNPKKESVPNFGVTEDAKVATVLENIASSNSEFSALAEALLPFVSENRTIRLKDHLIVDGKAYYDFNGGWNKETKIITLHPKILSDPNSLAQTFLHEVVHDLTHHQVKQYVTHDSTGRAVLLDANAPKAIQELVAVYNTGKNSINKEEFEKFLAKRKARQATKEDIGRYYGFTSIDEFMTMALTSDIFQEFLDTIPYNKTQSFLDKIKEVFEQLLQDLGLKFREGYIAKAAVESIFKIISETNTPARKNRFAGIMDQVNNTESFDLGNNGGAYDLLSIKPFSYVIREGFPFSSELLGQVLEGTKKITLRQPKFTENNREGIYQVGSKYIAVEKMSGEPVNIQYLLNKGETQQSILEAFGLSSLEEIKEQSVLDWFEGKGEKNIFIVKEVKALKDGNSNLLSVAPSNYPKFKFRINLNECI